MRISTGIRMLRRMTSCGVAEVQPAIVSLLPVLPVLLLLLGYYGCATMAAEESYHFSPSSEMIKIPARRVTSSSRGGSSTGSLAFRQRDMAEAEEVNEILSPYYYDDLRIEIENSMIDGNESFAIVTTDPNSTIYQVTLLHANDDDDDDDGENQTTYRFVELKSFIAFTKEVIRADDNAQEQIVISGAQNEAYAVLLAMYHFNNMIPLGRHPILMEQLFNDRNDPPLSVCNIKLTINILDSTFSPTIATQTVAEVLERASSISVPMTTAVVSSCPTTVTLPLAIFTGIYDVPFISATATSTGFDDKEQFPMFGRTVTNADGVAAVSLQFFQSVIQSTHVAILFVTDSFGSDIQKAFQEEATKFNIITESIAFSRNVSEMEATSVFESLKRLQYYHVYMICYPDQLDLLLTIAYDLGAIGPEYLYILPGLDIYTSQQTLRIKDGTSFSKAIQGIGVVQISAGITADRVIQGTVATPMIDENRTNGFERFRSSWRESLTDAVFQQYVQSKLPELFTEMTDFDVENFFLQDPIGVHAFIYDSVMAFGISMCRTNSSRNFFVGQDIYEHLRVLDIVGASGNVRMTSTGTRNHSSVAFVIWNVRSVGVDSDDASILEYVPSYGYDTDKWYGLPGNKFLFADGSETVPESLPPTNHEYNYITRSDRVFGYTLMSVILVSSLSAIIWTIAYRKNHVVDAAQPLFLIIVFAGAFIMALTTIPAGFDETVISSMNGLDTACMAVPWLYFMGSNLSSGALLAKTRAVYEAYVDPEIETIHVSSLDIIKSILYQSTVNFSLLLLWSLIAPLEWTRINMGATDNFNRPVESIANCAASGQSLAFAIVVIVVNMGFLILGTFWAYKSRNITTEYDESLYIGLCIVAVLQTWTIGLPILIVVRDNPSVSFYVQSGLVFVSSLAVIGFTFVPKVLAVRKHIASDQKQVYKEFKRAAILRQRAEEEDSDRDPNHAADLPLANTSQTKVGIRVLHNPRSQRNLAMAGGMELSRRQLQIWADAMSDDDMPSNDRMEQILEDDSANNGMESSNSEVATFRPLEYSLAKLPEPFLEADSVDSLDEEKIAEASAESTEHAETKPDTDNETITNVGAGCVERSETKQDTDNETITNVGAGSVERSETKQDTDYEAITKVGSESAEHVDTKSDTDHLNSDNHDSTN